MPGNATSVVEITHVSRHGFWLLLDNEELLVPFADFPWFRQATIDQLMNVERPTPGQMRPAPAGRLRREIYANMHNPSVV